MLTNLKSGYLRNRILFGSEKYDDKPRLIFIFLIVIQFVTASCGNLKQLQYVQGPIDTAALSHINFVEPTIQKGDVLGITVFSDNQLASAQFNQGNAGTAAGGSGYYVEQDGNIQLQAIGLMKVVGLTRRELSAQLARLYVEKDLLKNPYIDVRFLNFKVTVIGDVNSPGVKTFMSDKVSIFDAIGMAGDLTIYAKRDNILIVRETDGVRRFSRMDLTDPNVFTSPYYYLQQNDMIIVDPTKVKAATTDQTMRTITIATSIISLIAILYSVFR